MLISVLTLFPEMFDGPLNHSIIQRAIDKHIISIEYHNIRRFAEDSYKTVDGRPYGGGAGMIMRVDVIDKCLRYVLEHNTTPPDKTHSILLDPRGKVLTQRYARSLLPYDHLILLCGHYEGVDERVCSLVDESISIGNYILTGGELPAMVLIDCVSRLIPGTIKNEATEYESFSTSNTLEYPQYTRPRVFRKKKVPLVLLSGDHKKIDSWRLAHTKKRERK